MSVTLPSAVTCSWNSAPLSQPVQSASTRSACSLFSTESSSGKKAMSSIPQLTSRACGARLCSMLQWIAMCTWYRRTRNSLFWNACHDASHGEPASTWTSHRVSSHLAKGSPYTTTSSTGPMIWLIGGVAEAMTAQTANANVIVTPTGPHENVALRRPLFTRYCKNGSATSLLGRVGFDGCWRWSVRRSVDDRCVAHGADRCRFGFGAFP